LEAALNKIVGLDAVKDTLRSLRNRLVVGRKRAAFGIRDDLARAFIIVGSDGAAFEDVAKALCGLLKDLGVVGRDNLVVAKRHDVVKGSTQATQQACEGLLSKVQRGGLLLVRDAGSLAHGGDGGRHGTEAGWKF